MSTTATNYINLIRKDYPVRGRDNDSQGFRDNFTNIAEALRTINSDVTDLSNVAVLSNTTATFFGNNIEDANFKNCSTELWDNGTLSGNIFLDYTLGSYQKITVEAGDNFLNINNWPTEGTSGHMTLAVYPVAEEGVYTVKFVGDNITSLGPSKNPYRLVSGPNVFEIYSEFAAGADNATIHTRLLNELAQLTTATTQIRADELILNNKTQPVDVGQDLTFRVSSSTGATSATVVQTKIAGSAVAGNLALVANKIVHTIVDIDPTGYVSTTTANKIQLNSVSGILTGATFGLVNNNQSFSVTDISTTASVITCTPAFNVGIGTGEIIFRNPMFGDSIGGIDLGEKTAFPTLVTLLDGSEYLPANTSTGRTGIFRGSLYASANTLEVTFRDYGGSIKNTFTASTMVSNSSATVTRLTENDGADLANTRFVHDILPAGSIIMWYGAYDKPPTGWVICDGSEYVVKSYNGTTATIKSPDLRNRFIIGADQNYELDSTRATTNILGGALSTSSGGSAELKLVQHDHITTGSITNAPHFHEITDPGHLHNLTNREGGVFAYIGKEPVGADVDNDDRWCGYGGPPDQIYNTKTTGTNIKINTTVTQSSFNLTALSTGTVTPTTNTNNLPPFFALCYIMKVTGYRTY